LSTSPEPLPKARALLVLALLSAYLLIRADYQMLYVDEERHIINAFDLARGRAPSHSMPMWPGYHLIVAGLIALLQIKQPVLILASGRVTSLVMAWLGGYGFYRAARVLEPDTAWTKTLLYVACPLWFPYYLLAFTDGCALALFMVATWLLLEGRPRWAAVAWLAACSVRQSLLAFGLPLVALAWQRHRSWASVAPFAPALSIAVGAIVLHGGLLWDRRELVLNPPGLYVENFFYIGVYLAVVFAPWHWARREALAARLRQPATWLVLGLLAVGFAYGFACDSPFNQPPGYRDNDLVHGLLGVPGGRWLLFGVLALGFVGMSVQPLLQAPAAWLVYPAALLCVSGTWAFSVRYYFEACGLLLLLLREPLSPATARRLFWCFVACSVLEAELMFLRVQFPT
jgi:hypothetical protein